MYTTDFSIAPRQAQGTYAFYGGTQFSGLPQLVKLGRVWWRLSRRMRAAPGYRGHHIWYRWPTTFGNYSLWDSEEALMAFACTREHRDAIAWLMRPGTARAAFIRFLRTEPAGHSIGEWRAEDDGEAWRTPRLPFSTGSRPATASAESCPATVAGPRSRWFHRPALQPAASSGRADTVTSGV